MSKQIKEAKKGGHNKLEIEDVKITKDIFDKIATSLPNLVELHLISTNYLISLLFYVSCKLTTVPEFGQLPFLEIINLDNNQLEDFPCINLIIFLPFTFKTFPYYFGVWRRYPFRIIVFNNFPSVPQSMVN